MFRIALGKYVLSCSVGAVPDLYAEYRARAALADEFDIDRPGGDYCFLGVQEDQSWPHLVVAQRYSPSGYGFYPGALVISETDLLFVGAGARLLAYALDAHRPRLIEDPVRVRVAIPDEHVPLAVGIPRDQVRRPGGEGDVPPAGADRRHLGIR